MIQGLSLAWWPTHLTSAEEMQVQMIHRLGAILTVVDHNAITIVQTQFRGHFLADNQQMAEQSFIFFGGFRQLRDRLFRNDQKMRWRLSTDIVEGNTLLTKRKIEKRLILLLRSKRVTFTVCDIDALFAQRILAISHRI